MLLNIGQRDHEEEMNEPICINCKKNVATISLNNRLLCVSCYEKENQRPNNEPPSNLISPPNSDGTSNSG